MSYRSVQYFQGAVIHSIVSLYNSSEPIECDPCYNVGSMYQGLTWRPRYRFDLDDSLEGVVHADATCLPLSGSCIRSLIIDPPFLISAGSIGKMALKYGCYSDKQHLMESFYCFIKEAYRVIVEDGLFVFKCQDVIHDRRKFFQSLLVMNMAMKVGFNLLDQILYVPKSRLRSAPGASQKATHSWHSHFLVFRKKKSRTDYHVPAVLPNPEEL